LILVESDYLDRHVNEQREGFRIPEKQEPMDPFIGDLLSFEEIWEAIDPEVLALVMPPDWDKEAIVHRAAKKFGVSSTMIVDANVRIHFGDTEETVTERVLTAYQKRIIEDTSEIFDLKATLTPS
jgi:hypothetical protein